MENIRTSYEHFLFVLSFSPPDDYGLKELLSESVLYRKLLLVTRHLQDREGREVEYPYPNSPNQK